MVCDVLFDGPLRLRGWGDLCFFGVCVCSRWPWLGRRELMVREVLEYQGRSPENPDRLHPRWDPPPVAPQPHLCSNQKTASTSS